MTRLARFLCYPALFLGVAANCPAQIPEQAQPIASDLERVQNLVRANVLGLAREILETREPARQPTTEWLQWERQLWALYRTQGDWHELYERTRRLPPDFPVSIREEAEFQAIESLIALKQGDQARSLIRKKLPAADAPPQHRWLRQEVIATYLAHGLLDEARIAVDTFQRDYGSGETDWLLSAAVLLRTDNPDAAINLLAPMHQPGAQLMRLFARLRNRSLTPEQVIARAVELKTSPGGKFLAREIAAVVAQANIVANKPYPLVNALEDYLLTPASRDPAVSEVYPRFEIRDLFDLYARIARDQANQAGLLVGDEQRWLEYAWRLSPSMLAVRKSLFAYLAVDAESPAVRQAAIDDYISILIDTNRTSLIDHLFGTDTRFGKLTLGGEAGLHLATHALDKRDFRLAAVANENLLQLPEGVDRTAWLLQAGRIDIFAGRHQQGTEKLGEWIESHNILNSAQADTILQPVFDLQTVGQHELALELLHKINARAPAGKYRREIAYWLAESYVGSGQYTTAADLFLHSALQKANGFDRWGKAARFRAAEALMDGELFYDARQLFEDLLARATSESDRNRLKQKLQQLWLLLQASSESE